MRNLLALAMVLTTLHLFSQTITELQTFRGSDTPIGSGNQDFFGREIDISGNTAIVSAPDNDDKGAVYVFELINNLWVQVAKLTASDGVNNRSFGHSISIEGDVIAVGDPSTSLTNQGVYLFEKPVSGWSNMTETIKINTPYSVPTISGFGFVVELNSNGELLIGAPYEDVGAISSAGRIYIYEKSSTSWTSAFIRAELTTSNVGNGDLIGYSAIFGDNFIVSGAITGSTAGTLHVFEKPVSGTWANATVDDKILHGSDRSANDGFGGVVGTNGNFLVAHGAVDGAMSTDMNLYTFEREGSLWSGQSTQTEQLIATAPSYFPFSGFSSSYAIFSIDFQSNLSVIGNGGSTGPTPTNNSPCGSVYIIDQGNGQTIELDGLAFSPNGLFGSAVAIDGSRLLISSPQEDLGGVVRFFDISYNESTSQHLCSGESISFGAQTITTAGTYQELFTATNGLDSLVTLTVSLSDLSLSVTESNVSCFGGSDGQLVANPSGGTAPFEYSLDGINYVSSETFGSLISGSYDLHLRDANGCVVSETRVITEPDQIVLDQLAVSNCECSGEANGQIEVSALGGTGLIEFSVDGVNFGPSPITGLAAGSYDVQARDQNGCLETLQLNVPINEPSASKTPQSGALGTTTYGTDITGIHPSKDPTDAVSNYFYVSQVTDGRLVDSGGSEIPAGSFIQVANAANMKFEPLQASTDAKIGFQAAVLPRVTCIAGDTSFFVGTIQPALLSITPDDESTTYGTIPQSFDIIYSGFVNGEDASILDVLPTVSTIADETSGVGSYAIVSTGAVDDNYTFTYQDGTLTISSAPLTVTVNDKTMIYGEALPTFDGSIVGLVNNDDITATYSSNADGSSAGSFSIDAVLNDKDSKLSNYAVTNNSGMLLINQAMLTVTANDKSITYGESLPTFDGTLVGVVSGDAITATYANTSDGSAGTSEITASLVDPNNQLTNYSVTNTSGTLTINTASLSVNASDKSITYGEPLPTFDGTLTGVINGDNITASFSSIADGAQAGNFDIQANLNDPDSRLSNYTVTSTNGQLSIGKAVLTLSAQDALMTYGEGALPALSFIYSGFVNQEDETVVDTPPSTISTAALATSDVGTYAIDISQDADDNNYDFQYVPGVLTIQQATLNVAVDDANKIYGAQNPVFTASYSGLVNEDSQTDLDIAPVMTTQADELSDVGNYPILADGGQDVNYQFHYSEGTLTISKASLIVTANDITITEEEAVPALTYSFSGFVNGEDESVIDQLPSLSTSGTAGIPGEYPITFTAGSDNNYEMLLMDGTLFITRVLNVSESRAEVYPNPTSENLKIKGVDFEYLTLSDINGREVKNSSASYLNISDLPKTVYLLRLFQGGRVVHQQKIKIN